MVFDTPGGHAQSEQPGPIRPRKPIKLAFVHDQIYPYFKGGVEKRMFDFARELAERGHEVHLIGTKRWDGPDHLTKGRVVMSGIRSRANPHTSGGRRSIWQAVTFAIGLARRVSRERFDIIDVQSTAPLACLTVLMIARLRRIPVVVTWIEVWGSYWREYMGPIGYAGQILEWLMARVGRFHAGISAETLRRMEEIGLRADALLPCGIDAERIESVEAGAVSSDVICVSRLVQHKNLEFLIDAMTVLKADGHSPTTLIVGDGPEYETLRLRIESAGLDNVSLLTDVASENELFALLKASRVFALPSVREGFGLAVAEAAACGLPAVLVDHQDNASTDLVHSDLVVPQAPELYAAKIWQLLNDDELHAKMSKHAADSVSRFTLRPIIDRSEQLYAEVLDASRR